MTNNKNKDSLNKIYTRIAWYDRESSRYDYGEWHDISKNLNYENLGKWVNNQNRNHPRVKYWLENISEGDSKKAKNAESYQLNSIGNRSDDDIVNEWITVYDN